MFVSQAHSFKQQARLAVTLAWVSGYTNIVTLLACHTVTSHVSGTTSSFGKDLFTGEWKLAGFGAFLLGTFFIGAAAAGFCTEWGRRRGWNSIYVLPMMVEAVLLALFAILLEILGQPMTSGDPTLFLMVGLASAAMGLQNATITRISNGTVRTTHVTGVITDLGHESVQFLYWCYDRRRNVAPSSAAALIHGLYVHPTARRLSLLAAILGTFALGAGLGTLAHLHIPRWAMFAPVAFLGWIIYQDVTQPIAEIAASTLIGAADQWSLPASLAVFHLRRDVDRLGKVHRMPNLLAWSERLPPEARVVILDLAQVSQLDANAALELRALVNQFSVQQRELIIAGISYDQFRQINIPTGTGHLDEQNVCPDLELAIARGINLV